MDWLTTVFVGPVVDPSRRTGPQNRKYYFNQSVTNPATVPPIHPLAYQEGRKQTTDSSSQPTENAVGVHIPSTPVVAWNWRVHCFTTSLQLRRQYLLSSSVWCKHRNCILFSSSDSWSERVRKSRGDQRTVQKAGTEMASGQTERPGNEEESKFYLY